MTVQDFIKEVKNRLSLNNKKINVQRSGTGASGNRSLNMSSDADYEFYNSDDDDSSDEDEEMKENMRRLVEKEKDDEGLCDSGYSESFSSSKSTMFDHSYSKPLQSLCRPHSKRETKGVAALLSLADAASKELENLGKDSNSKNYLAQNDVKSSLGPIKSC